AARLHPNDAVRIVRALEVHAATGSPISELQRRDRASSQRVAAVQIGLTLPRAELYFRIERRVDEMLEQGLESEVRRLLERGYSPQHGPMRSLGYKEMVQYVMGELSHSEMASATKQSTRRYAKRQMTWFRADPGIVWIDAAANNSATVASRIEAVLETVP
ncbi:MAG TPA: tRNA dimethylallyltransferase, partial [Chthonomonadaceae bacterium]|nr:tRNA dimethylallyltransferase [Chthonomonadaceae bacterium]